MANDSPGMSRRAGRSSALPLLRCMGHRLAKAAACRFYAQRAATPDSARVTRTADRFPYVVADRVLNWRCKDVLENRGHSLWLGPPLFAAVSETGDNNAPR